MAQSEVAQEAVHEPPRWKARFFAIWTGQAFSLLGSNLVQFALVWWLTVTTNSATILATATMVAMLPQVLIGPLAGTLVDRWNRKRIMILADGSVAAATALLALLFATGAVEVWHVYVLLAVRSTAGSFHFPAMSASTSLMVPEKHLARVGGMNQTLQGVMSILGPPAGAVLLKVLPMFGILMIDITTAAIAIMPLFFVRIPQPERKAQPEGAGAQKASIWREMAEGFRYVRAWPGLMILMGVACLLNFVLNPAFSLLSLLVKTHFLRDAGDLALLNTTFGIGMVAGGLLLSVWGGFKRRMITSLLGVVGIGLGTLAIGIAPESAFVLAVVGMFLAGTSQPLANGPIFAVMQSTVAPEMQGRVFTLLQSVATAMSPLSLAVAGPISDAVGIQAWYVVAGVACLLMAAVSRSIPALLYIEDNHQGAHTQAAPAELEIVPQQPA